jgi:chitinase
VATVTITDDDGVPALRIAASALVEGDAGTRTARVPVSLSPPAGLPVTVRWHTWDWGATEADTDYVGASDSLVFASGDSLKFAEVRVLGDRRAELDEAFAVSLSNPVGATIADTTALVTIANDDLPQLTVGDVSVNEGAVGTVSARVPVRLSGPVSYDVSVDWRTVDSSATVAGNDYVALSDTLVFLSGAEVETVTVFVRGDLLTEPAERFWVVLSNPMGAILGDSVGAVTIVNDDGIVAVDDGPPVTEFALRPPTPNPNSGSAVRIRFELPRPGHVHLVLYDVAGREVARLVDEDRAIGRHSVTWRRLGGSQAAASGVYFLRFQAGGKDVVRRLVVLR